MKPNEPVIFRFKDELSYEEEKQEIKEIQKWKEKEILKEFEPVETFSPKFEKLADLSWMCSDLTTCKSFQSFGLDCKCFRKNFSGPDQVKLFAEKYLELTKQELLEIVKGEKNE